MSDLHITFLGTGTSHGMPMIACDCPACRSDDPRDRRYRASVALTAPNLPQPQPVLLIDVSPEFRLAAIENRLPRVDAVLLTHAHADHIMGLDDLRRYNNLLGRTIPIHASPDTLDTVNRCFPYAISPYLNPDRPSLSLHPFNSPADIAGLTVTPIPLTHGRITVNGFRIGRFAYCTDCSAVPPASLPLLENLDTLILGAIRYTPHPAHFNFDQALDLIARIRPRQTYLTHIAHEIIHARASAELPPHVAIAHDGLTISARLD